MNYSGTKPCAPVSNAVARTDKFKHPTCICASSYRGRRGFCGLVRLTRFETEAHKMTTRKVFLLAGMLFLLIAVKFALGQDESGSIGWDADTYQDPLDCVLALMMAAPILGSVFGAIRILNTRSARPVLEPIRLN